MSLEQHGQHLAKTHIMGEFLLDPFISQKFTFALSDLCGQIICHDNWILFFGKRRSILFLEHYFV